MRVKKSCIVCNNENQDLFEVNGSEEVCKVCGHSLVEKILVDEIPENIDIDLDTLQKLFD